MAIHMFQQLIDTLKKSPKRIVFTEENASGAVSGIP